MNEQKKNYDFSEDIYSATDTALIEEDDVEIPETFENFEVATPDTETQKERSLARFFKNPARAVTSLPKRQVKKPKTQRVFNNGEPLSFAIKRIIKECVFVIICAAIVGGFFVGRQLFIAKTTEDGISSFFISSQYKKTRAVDKLKSAPQIESDGYSCIEVVSSFLSKPIDEKKMRSTYKGKDITAEASGMEIELSRALTGMTITRRENISDYTLMTQIYESLKKGKPVIVGCTNAGGSNLSYAVVSSINTAKDKIGLIRPDGTIHSVDSEKFLASTRYENANEIGFFAKLGLITGYYNINTAFFIADEKK